MSGQAEFRVVRTDAGWLVRVHADNGLQVARSSETYTSRAGARRCIEIHLEILELVVVSWDKAVTPDDPGEFITVRDRLGETRQLWVPDVDERVVASAIAPPKDES